MVSVNSFPGEKQKTLILHEMKLKSPSEGKDNNNNNNNNNNISGFCTLSGSAYTHHVNLLRPWVLIGRNS